MTDPKELRKQMEPLISELFQTYRTTGERQHILAGLFAWLKDNKYDPMSPGEVRAAIRMGFPEVL